MILLRPFRRRAGELAAWPLLLILGSGLAFGATPASRPSSPADGNSPAKLPADLDPTAWNRRLNSPDFAIRQQATYDLLDAGADSLPVLRRIMSTQPLPEVQMRIRLVAELLFSQLTLPAGEQQSFLGIQMAPYEDPKAMHEGGVEVTAILPFMPAERAGLKVGDIIEKVDRQPLPRFESTAILQNRIQQLTPGQKLELLIKRGDKEFSLVVAPTIRPLCYSHTPDLPEVVERFKAWYLREIDPGANVAELDLITLADGSDAMQNVRIQRLQGGQPIIIRNNGQGQVIINNVNVAGQQQGQMQIKIQVQGNGGGIIVQDAKIQVKNGGVVIQEGKAPNQNDPKPRNPQPAASQPADKSDQ